MVRSNIISEANANRLYWLGRYEERVYLTLHMLRKCYDAMIDGEPNDYKVFWQKLDATGNYNTDEDFTLGMMYDNDNPGSVISAQTMALDNAMMLRNYIATETQAFLEMSLALMRRKKDEKARNITELQPVTDWSLAFWGSAEERIEHRKVMLLMIIGRKIECIDMMVRFDYPYERIRRQFDLLVTHLEDGDIYDDAILEQLETVLNAGDFNLNNGDYKSRLLKLINTLIRV